MDCCFDFNLTLLTLFLPQLTLMEVLFSLLDCPLKSLQQNRFYLNSSGSIVLLETSRLLQSLKARDPNFSRKATLHPHQRHTEVTVQQLGFQKNGTPLRQIQLQVWAP